MNNILLKCVCTIIFTSLSEGVQFTNGWSSSLIAVGLSAGFRQKQHCKKSLPSADSVSGIGGVSFKTLNNAAGCITGTISSENQYQMEFDAFDRPIVNSKGTKPKGAYPFAVAPRRLSIYHFNYGTAQTPYIYCQSKICTSIFWHCRLQELQNYCDVSVY